MNRHLGAFAGLMAALAGNNLARADGVAVSTPSPVSVSTQVDPATLLIHALSADPWTAPYQFTARVVGRQVALSGRVGSRLAHDAALRVASGIGYPVRDDLIIDTLESARAGVPNRPVVSRIPYVYPQSVFGRPYDPFYGMEPPLVSYPPYAAAVGMREPINTAKIANAMSPGPAPVDAMTLTLDERGVVTLRGRVSTLAERAQAEQEAARVRGVAQVVNLLEVGPPSEVAPPRSDVPPPRRAPRGCPFRRPLRRWFRTTLTCRWPNRVPRPSPSTIRSHVELWIRSPVAPRWRARRSGSPSMKARLHLRARCHRPWKP